MEFRGFSMEFRGFSMEFQDFCDFFDDIFGILQDQVANGCDPDPEKKILMNFEDS